MSIISELNSNLYHLYAEHCQEAQNVNHSYLHRVCHAFMAAAEYPPIVGHIIALFELAVRKVVNSIYENFPTKLNERKIDVANSWTPTVKSVGIIALVGLTIFSALYIFSNQPDDNQWPLESMKECAKNHTYPFVGLIKTKSYENCIKTAWHEARPEIKEFYTKIASYLN